MAKLFAVLAIVLAVSMAKQHKFENTKQILAEVNRDAFGNSILSLVHLASMTGEPTD